MLLLRLEEGRFDVVTKQDLAIVNFRRRAGWYLVLVDICDLSMQRKGRRVDDARHPFQMTPYLVSLVPRCQFWRANDFTPANSGVQPYASLLDRSQRP